MTQHSEQLLLAEAQVLLAEKRTYFSILRTGLAVITVPPTIILFLLATTPYHHIFDQVVTGVLVVGGLLLISGVGLYITINAQRKINRLDKMISRLEEQNQHIKDIII